MGFACRGAAGHDPPARAGCPRWSCPEMTPGRPKWARVFAGPYVSMVLDCDRAGREAAARIAADLRAASVGGSIVDLARARADGYDLTEWLAEPRGPGCAGAAPGAWAPATRAARPGGGGWSTRVGGYAASSSRFAVHGLRLVCAPVVRARRRAGEEPRGWCAARRGRGRRSRGGKSPSAVRDVGTGGDLAVGESESAGAADRLLVFGVSVSRLRLAARVTCRSTSPLSSCRARSSPSRSASAIALRRAPAAIAALPASPTRRAAWSTADRSCPVCACQPVPGSKRHSSHQRPTASNA